MKQIRLSSFGGCILFYCVWYDFIVLDIEMLKTSHCNNETSCTHLGRRAEMLCSVLINY